ncbi:DUF7695 domain-containing protein [Ornithinibacillus caprae]|uniref:DUF7695 domain-containing protein n=1 Tax=Ornithinibacillus caprae TaxID=2678566 RepID=UPI003CCE2EFB
MKRVLINRVRCKKCDDIIESKHCYDFKRCKCRAIFLDGGKDYQRYGWGNQTENARLEVFIDFSYTVSKYIWLYSISVTRNSMACQFNSSSDARSLSARNLSSIVFIEIYYTSFYFVFKEW